MMCNVQNPSNHVCNILSSEPFTVEKNVLTTILHSEQICITQERQVFVRPVEATQVHQE